MINRTFFAWMISVLFALSLIDLASAEALFSRSSSRVGGEGMPAPPFDNTSKSLPGLSWPLAAAAVQPLSLVPLDGVAAIAAGDDHTCALTASGGVKCWGTNWSGQLGDGTTDDRLTPVDVSGLSSGVTAIAASRYHTCALTASGGVKCWGTNWYGQLGDGTTDDRLTPVNVSGLSSGVTAIAASRYHTCALTVSGGVMCWGAGPLGDGTTDARLTPVDVSGLSSGVTAIAAGGNHTCALTASGGVKCWGENAFGQLGDGTIDARLTPVDVSGLSSGVTAIAAGVSHTCALTVSGGVKCWGENGDGQLGNGTDYSRLTPVDVSGLSSGVAAIAAGWRHTCALTASGGVKCWGSNGYGQLGIVPGIWIPVDVMVMAQIPPLDESLYLPVIVR